MLCGGRSWLASDMSDMADMSDMSGMSDMSDMSEISDMSDMSDTSDMSDMSHMSDMSDIGSAVVFLLILNALIQMVCVFIFYDAERAYPGAVVFFGVGMFILVDSVTM